MDEGDLAQDWQARSNAAAIAAHRHAMAANRGPATGICTECGDEIPPRRREAVPGCVLCVDCQAGAERAAGA